MAVPIAGPTVRPDDEGESPTEPVVGARPVACLAECRPRRASASSSGNSRGPFEGRGRPESQRGQEDESSDGWWSSRVASIAKLEKPFPLRDELMTARERSKMVKRSAQGLLLVCEDNDRGLSVDGRAYSQLLDPIGDRLAEQGVTVWSSAATPKTRLLGDTAHNSPLGFSQSEKKHLKISAVERRGFVAGFRSGNRVWVERIKRSNVGAVMGIQPPELLCEAGRQLGVKVFDLQHGHISLPDAYYSRFSRGGNVQKSKSAPDAVLCWDEPACEFVSNRLDADAIIVGHPSFALAVPGSATSGHDACLAAFRAAFPGLERVVVVLDFYPSNGIATETDHSHYLELIAQVALSHRDTAFILRPHPVQLRSFWHSTFLLYKKLFARSGNIFFHGSAEGHPPLAMLLKISDGVVSTGGAGLIESSFLGVPTAVLRVESTQIEALYQEQYRGHLAYIRNINLFNDWIAKLERRWKVGDSQIFEDHARRMNDFLDSLHLLCAESGHAST